MNGLGKIVGQIERETEERVAHILKEARTQAEQIEQKADTQERVREAEQARQVETEKRNLLERQDSENRRARKEALLRTKNEWIEQVITQAKTRIITLSEEQYLLLLRRLLEKNAQAGSGALYLAKEDAERLSDDFGKKLCKGLHGEKKVAFAGTTDAISHGFVISYGKVEQNCSIDSIFESEHSRIVDTASACLAKEAGGIDR
jgi:V/A-type H+-transporting ATPase subunit E